MATPEHVILNPQAYVRSVSHTDATTRKHQTIEVSLRPARPPLPSDLLVHCSDLDPAVPPRIVRAVEGLLLLRVPIGCSPDYVSPDECDYFVYRADPQGGPSLQRLSRPHPSFHDDEVGLLARGDNYTIAVLSATPTEDVYDLHLFHSETPETWIFRQVSVEEPQEGFPLEIPINCHRLFYHDTTTVVTIGGEGGTMGWVDLWRGILLCDVLSEKPALRGVPVPMPVNLMNGNNGNGFELGCPKSLRGISFISDGKSGTGCLKLVQLEAKATQLPYPDDRVFLMHDWTITAWSNTKMSGSWEDWEKGHMVQASDITVDSQLNSELLDSGLLLCKPTGDVDGAERALQNLLVSDPAPGIDAAQEDIVYLMARVKFLHPKAWVLALDMRNSTLQGAAEFGTKSERGTRVVCCPGSISKYMTNLDV